LAESQHCGPMFRRTSAKSPGEWRIASLFVPPCTSGTALTASVRGRQRRFGACCSSTSGRDPNQMEIPYDPVLPISTERKFVVEAMVGKAQAHEKLICPGLEQRSLLRLPLLHCLRCAFDHVVQIPNKFVVLPIETTEQQALQFLVHGQLWILPFRIDLQRPLINWPGQNVYI
jgi:hypothetical protein